MLLLKNHLFKFTAILTLAFAISACSDDPASSGPEEDPPLIPEMNSLQQVDLSFFEGFEGDDIPYGDEEYSAYFHASTYSMTIGFISGLSSLHTSFLSLAEGKDPEFKDGKWVWEYSYTESGSFNKLPKEYSFLAKAEESITIRLTGHPVSNGMEWNLYISGVFDGEVVEEYVMLNGFISTDESEGNWRFYSPESGTTPVLSSEWSLESDTLYEYKVTLYGDANETQTFIFSQDGPEHWISIEGSNPVAVYWNDDTGLGWYEEDGARTCFDAAENYRNTPCAA